MFITHSGHLIRCLLLLMLCSPFNVIADSLHPLEPVDLSSPRATLNNFLKMGDAVYQMINDEYWENPGRAYSERLIALAARQEAALDLSGISPAERFDRGRDGNIYLYEVLSRIELPPAADIPDATAYKKDKYEHWTIPHTDIMLVRIKDGPSLGQFLFSSSTVIRAKEFYEKIRTLPYRRDIPLKNYAEKRHYLSGNSWMISSYTIESFPHWLKYDVYQQALWKWFALVIIIIITFTMILIINKQTKKAIPKRSTAANVHHLVLPILLLLIPLVLETANIQLTLTGWVSGGVISLSVAILYFLVAWILWTGSMVVAELIIMSPKIDENSLNAHLIRLVARTFSIISIIAIILYVSSQLGAPLYSLLGGLGVGGIAVALASQPTIENFIGSLNLFADNPVRIGDFCRYGEDPTPDWSRTGTLVSIGLRSTKIRGVDDTVTTIPNAEFSKMHIVNFSIRRHMLLLTMLGLRYETSDDQLRFVLVKLREMLLAHPRVIDDEPRVRFAGFGDYSLNVEIRVNINAQDNNEFRAIREDIFLYAMKIIKDAGTGFAFPSRTIYHARDDGLDTERQNEAEAKVRSWCAAQELPFPTFTADYRKKTRNTIDYPPEGSPWASE